MNATLVKLDMRVSQGERRTGFKQRLGDAVADSTSAEEYRPPLVAPSTGLKSKSKLKSTPFNTASLFGARVKTNPQVNARVDYFWQWCF